MTTYEMTTYEVKCIAEGGAIEKFFTVRGHNSAAAAWEARRRMEDFLANIGQPTEFAIEVETVHPIATPKRHP